MLNEQILAILELCAFYIEYKKVKFKTINFRGWNVLRFCKDTANVFSLLLLKITTKPTHFLPVKENISILWIELHANKMQKVSKPLTSKNFYRAVKNLQIGKTFSKNVNKEATWFFKKWVIFSITVVFCLFTCTNQCTKNLSVKNLFSKCEHIRIKLRIYSNLLNKSLTDNKSLILLILLLSLANFSSKLIASLSYNLHKSTLNTDLLSSSERARTFSTEITAR